MRAYWNWITCGSPAHFENNLIAGLMKMVGEVSKNRLKKNKNKLWESIDCGRFPERSTRRALSLKTGNCPAIKNAPKETYYLSFRYLSTFTGISISYFKRIIPRILKDKKYIVAHDPNQYGGNVVDFNRIRRAQEGFTLIGKDWSHRMFSIDFEKKEFRVKLPTVYKFGGLTTQYVARN